jgi:hypothetical protein
VTIAAPPRFCVAICAALIVGSLGYGLLQVPLLVHDSLDKIVDAERSPGLWASFTSEIGTTDFRPLWVAEIKLLFDLSRGHVHLAYKAFHIALLVAAFGLFVAALRIETGVDLAASLFALSVLVGSNAFTGLVKEATPVNVYLPIVVFVLLARHLSRIRHGWWVDAAAVLTLIAACLTLESGVLVWVALVAGRIAGRRGVSDRALLCVTVLMVVYLVVRLTMLPLDTQNTSGYLAERLEADQIRERFGVGLSSFGFRIYTVLASISSVLFSEPRDGTVVVLRAWEAGDIPPRMWINIASSVVTTVLIGIAAWRLSRSATVAADPHRDDMRADFFVFGAVLAASGVASFAYAKDVIMSSAGACYALVAFWAVRDQLIRVRPSGAAVAMAAVLLAVSSLWAVRVIGVHHVLRTQAFAFHNDWAAVRYHLPDNPAARRLVTALRADALSRPVVNPWFVPRWADRVFDIDYF